MHPHASLLSLSCDQPHSTCVGYSEVCKESIQMYRKHFPTHPNLGDVTKISWNQQKQGTIDLLVGGSPCQNLTTANNLGSNNGLQGKKSGLFFHYCRLFREMGCRYFILENVSRMKKESLHEITKQLQTLTPLKVNKYVQLYLFPNSFTLFNTVKYCQILSNTVKYCQILSNHLLRV
jgi:site-specific DNA-cytosine methylase